MNYNKDIDSANVRTYRETVMRRPSECRYTCVICENKTCIDSSFSQAGHKLICISCARSFGSIRRVFEWLSYDDV